MDLTSYDSLADMVVTIGRDSVIVYANQAATSLLGWRTDELVGQHIALIQPEALRPRHMHCFGAFVAERAALLPTGATTQVGNEATLPALRSDGSLVNVTGVILAHLPANAAEEPRFSLRGTAMSGAGAA